MRIYLRVLLAALGFLSTIVPAAAQMTSGTSTPPTGEGGFTLLWVWVWILVVGIIVFIVGTSYGNANRRR